jgi:ABC-type transport system involved in cytochrome bd biosynthesis fused ATPase/permease subunit
VLLLDEATANLDPETERDVLDTIKALRGNMTILMIAHRPHPALAPDQIITLGGQT